MFLSSSQRTLTTTRDPSKFPTTQLFLLALVRLAEPIALTSIIPYAWQLVRQFHVGNESDASFYAGLLVSAFALAEAVTAMYWGGLSDKIGRKPVIIMGGLGTIASLLILGFSCNLWMALFARFLGGALNGNMGVVQTIVSEIVVNPKHEPKAFAVMPFVWSIGTVVGPFLGGYFACPSESFPKAFASNGLFATFPYLMPNLICAGLMTMSVLAGYFFLEETHPDKQPGPRLDSNDGDHTYDDLPEYSTIATESVDDYIAATYEEESYGTFNPASESIWDKKSLDDSPSPTSNPHFFTKQVIMVTIALGIYTYHSMTFESVLPIFFQDDRSSSPDFEALHLSATSNTIPSISSSSSHFSGGLGLSVQSVGIIMSVDGLIALFIQATIFPLLTAYLGVWHLFLLVTILHPIAYILMPFLAFLSPAGGLLYPGIYLALTTRNFFSIITYPLLLILVKEANPDHKCRGRINGLAASTGAACRTVASPAAGLLYGIGMKVGFNALVWWTSAVVAGLGAVQAFAIQRAPAHARHPAVAKKTARKAGSGRRMSGEEIVHTAKVMEECGHPLLFSKASVVSIASLGSDSGYESDEDERTPLLVALAG